MIHRTSIQKTESKAKRTVLTNPILLMDQLTKIALVQIQSWVICDIGMHILYIYICMGYTLYTFAVLHFSTVFVLFINHIPNSPGTFPPPDPAKRSAPVIPRFADGRISPVRATWVGCVTSGDAKQTRAILGDGVKVETCFFRWYTNW